MYSLRNIVTIGLFALCGVVSLSSAGKDLDDAFGRPPDAVKPWCYWWWLNGNVDRTLITQNLEAMKRVGFGGLLQFDARSYHDDIVPMPPSRLDFMSPAWREMLKFSLEEAHRLGLEVSVNLSSCAGALKGPWEVGDDAPKQLIWTATEVHGPKPFTWELKKPAEKRFWDIALLAVRSDDMPAGDAEVWHDPAPRVGEKPSAAEVVDLTDKIDRRGRLSWTAPAGRWVVLRFGCSTMRGHEYDVDILDAKAVTGHFERMGRAILRDAGPLAGKTLTHFYSVSWEGAAPTWTLALPREFANYRGYELRPWLPVLAGMTLKSREVSERFLRDYYRTLGDSFRDNFYGTMQDLCHRAGLKWHSESGGPWDRKLAAFGEADQLAFLARNDMPQGEFWFTGTVVRRPGQPPSLRHQDLNRPQAMTAHIYGKPLAASEAFTHMVRHWSAYPAALKPFADTAFCDGVNHFVWHTFTASPPEFGKPGNEYFAGTHINPNVTWFPQAGPFMAYLARCQLMLRQGLFVGDVCTYLGEKPYYHWNRGPRWSDQASLTLPKGYAYDVMNSEVLLTRLAVKNGDLVLPDGMRYRILAVDLEDDATAPEVLQKINELAEAGATIVLGRRQPQAARSLADYPACDEKVRRFAAGLWNSRASESGERAVGRGKVIQGAGLEAVLKSKGILPDFEGPWEYIHRRSAEADIYYVTGEGTASCMFRVQGKEPELWDPVTGQRRDGVVWHASAEGRTVVPLNLPENGSVFVVFRRPAEKQHLVAVLDSKTEIVGRTDSGADVRKWNNDMGIKGPWTVQFEPGRGAPASAVFETLTAWDQHADPGIKFFSGAATYRKTFTLTDSQASHPVRLDLGDVKHVAVVRLNGRELGIVWTAPWTVDLTGAVRRGQNELEITAVNTWVNRLIGDAALPKDQQITRSCLPLAKGKRTFPVYKGYASEDPLMPSGLLGPVRLEFGERQFLAW